MTGKQRLIVGAGGFGREIRQFLAMHSDLEVIGFLAADHPADVPGLGAPYLGVISSEEQLEVPCIVGVGYPAPKRAIFRDIETANRPLAPPVVHPRADVGSDVHLSVGVVITSGVVATANIRLGRCVSLHPGALLGHDVVCEDFCAVMPGAAISGNTHLEEGVLVGTNAAILQGVHVGAWATIGAGAVVTSDVSAGTTVAGIPASQIP